MDQILPFILTVASSVILSIASTFATMAIEKKRWNYEDAKALREATAKAVSDTLEWCSQPHNQRQRNEAVASIAYALTFKKCRYRPELSALLSEMTRDYPSSETARSYALTIRDLPKSKKR